MLRTARERGEKIKQPFKFFFPNRKDDDVGPRSATAPVPAPEPAASRSSRRSESNTRIAGGSNTRATNASNARPASQPNGNGARAQTLPAQPSRGQPNGQGKGKGKGKGPGNATATAAQASTQISAAIESTVQESNSPNGQGRGKGKGKGKGKGPPEIRAAKPSAAPATPRGQGKRPANAPTAMAPPQAKKPKQKSNTQPPNKPPQPPSTPGRRQHRTFSPDRSNDDPSGRNTPRSRSAVRRDRSASPRPHDSHRRFDDDVDDHRYSQRLDRSRDRSPPRRGRDSWVSASARDPGAYEDGHTGGWDFRNPPASLPTRPSWTDVETDHRDDVQVRLPSSSSRVGRGARSPRKALFRAETRSPTPPTPRPSQPPTPRGGHRGSGRRGSASPRPPPPGLPPPPPPSSQGSNGDRRNAVQRALENLAATGFSPNTVTRSQSQSNSQSQSQSRPYSPQVGEPRQNGWNRTWHRGGHAANNNGGRQPHGQQQHRQQSHGAQVQGMVNGGGDAGWPGAFRNEDRFVPPSPRTPPRSD